MNSAPSEQLIHELEEKSLLRQIVGQDSYCTDRFREAQSLSVALFDSSRPPTPKAVIPFYTDHSANHFGQIERYANLILFGNRTAIDNPSPDGAKFFTPTPEEAMYLLSAIWLHDIGMIAGLETTDSVGQDTDWERIRSNHEIRSSDYIRTQWSEHCRWTAEQKGYLGELCIHHRKKWKLGEMDLAEVTGRDDKPVRLRELAGILRLADACHLDVSRAPIGLMNIFQSVGMPMVSRVHWGHAHLVSKVEFNHDAKEIGLVCDLPRAQQFGSATFSFGGIVDRIALSLAEELISVEPYLTKYDNTAFHKVTTTKRHPVILYDASSLLCDLWPDLLASLQSASETTCMLARALDATVQVFGKGGQIPKHKVTELIKFATGMYKFNIPVYKLCSQVANFEGSVEKLREYLLSYATQRVVACNRVAEAAFQKLQIKSEDYLVLFGFSHSVMSMFRRHLRSHKGVILVVECRSARDGSYVNDEAERVGAELDELGLDWRFVRLESLALILEYYCKKRAPQNAIIPLLGTSGIYNGGEALCHVGSASFALTVKEAGAKVYVLADPEKRTQDKGTAELIEQQISEAAAPISKTQIKATELRPEIDVLKPEWYELIADDLTQVEAAAGLGQPHV